MKRSRVVNLVLLGSAAVSLESCGRNECVDERNIVVEDRFCRDLQGNSLGNPGGHFYHSYYSGPFRSHSIGSSVGGSTFSGTTRGVFGHAGSAAHGGGGE